MNHLYQGLLHSFARHGSEWTDFIGNLDRLNGRLSAIRQHLSQIESARNAENARSELAQLEVTLRGMLQDEGLLGKLLNCAFK